MNQYRCETCKKEHHYENRGYRNDVLICEGEELPINCENFTESKGCASHSSFQSDGDKVLDEMCNFIRSIVNEMRANGLKCDWKKPSVGYESIGIRNIVEKISELRQKAGEP